MRKARSPSSSSSSSSPPRAAGVNRYGRSGLDSAQFHTGPIAKTTVPLVLKTDHPPRRCARCNHSPLIGSRCASCGLDHRDERRHRPRRLDNSLGDDLDNADEGLLGDREDDDSADEG